MSTKANFYKLLGLKKDATFEEIRRAYRQAAQRLHPDVNVKPGETEMFLSVTNAYEVLSNPESRADYDEGIVEENDPLPPVSLTITYSRRELPLINEAQLIYTLLELSPLPGTGSLSNVPSRPPINICLVLDRSTSMQGARMDTIKSAAIELVRQLGPEDIFSLIVFSDRAEVLIPAGRAHKPLEIETAIRMIQPGGGTELFQGLDAGFFQIRRNLSKKYVNHLILLTDGNTYGDEAECLDLADQASAQGVAITGMGIGDEWNDSFLDSVVTRTGGSSMYIARAGDISHFLEKKFSGLSQVYGEKVTLKLETGPGVKLRYAFRLRPESSPLKIASSMRVGQILSGSSLSILLEFEVDPLGSGRESICLGKGEISLDILSRPDVASTLELNLSRPVATQAGVEGAPREILNAVSHITLYKMQERAKQEVNAGKPEIASRRLQQLATHLLSQGRRDLAQAALNEAEAIQISREYTREGEKRIKYGTRGLILPAGDREADP